MAAGDGRLDALFARWIEFIDIRPASVEIYASATRLFLRWLRVNGEEAATAN
jgi:hypothetical protein